MPTPPPSRGRALLALLRPDARRWAVLGALLAVNSTLMLAGPLVVRTIVDRASDGAPASEFVRLALIFLGLAVATQAIAVLVTRWATVTAWGTTNQLRLRITRHVLGLDHEFHRRHTPGELIQRVDGDVTSVSDFLGQVVPKAVGGVLLIGGMIAVLTVVDWRVGLGMALYVGATVAVLVRMRHHAVREASEEMGATARLYGGIEERLTAAEDLRSNGAGVHAMWRFVEDSSGLLLTSVRRHRAFIRMWWAVPGAVASGAVLSLVVSATLVSRGIISLGTAFLLFQYVLLISRPLEDLVHQLETVQKANGAMVHVIDLLALQPSIVDDGTTTPPPGALAVTCRGVSFSYSGGDDGLEGTPDGGDEQTILHDLDLHIAPGRSVGVVGRTGSGKTTFSRLLLRLVEATDGVVALGGVPIADIPMSELRRRVALVPQEVELFDGTVRDNVTLFDPAPTDAAVEDALQRVGLRPLVAAGIHRHLGAGGAGLSAGEAQLLALARVWLRQPDLVVLDEATARIDPLTERRLEAAVAQLIAGRTTLIIAHKLSTLRMVDEVIVFDRGRIVEHDDRSVLAAKGGSRYRYLLELALEVDSVMTAPSELGVWRVAWRVSQHEPRSFWLGWVAFVVFFSMPALTGFLLSRGFEALSAGETADVYRYGAAVVVAETLRMASVHLGAITWAKAWVHMQTLLRANLLTAQVASGGPEAGQPVGSSGEAVTHFRDDTEDIAMLVDGTVDVSGGLVFTFLAGLLLGSADPTGAAVLLLPLIGVVLVTRSLDGRIKAYRAADRAATSSVTGLVGDVMAAATTVKVNGATDAMLDRLRGLVDRRRATAVRDRVLDEGIMAFSQGSADVGLGLVLLVSAGALADGSFAVGTLALFVAYLGWLSFLPRMIGRMLARRKQAAVAVDRMRQLVAGRDVANTVRPRALPLERRQRGERPADDRPARVPLQRLDVVALTARFPGGAGVHDISFTMGRGDFVVLTGPVGSGKSTLLRAVLGLAWQADIAGEVRWNGELVADRAAFMVPPNAAFLPQVPQLVSDSVRDNVGLGPVPVGALQRALRLAAVDDDIAGLPDGEDTLIGPRGLRLSGGQRQRLATARALVHGPELVVLDDLSSAVDVETELQLWNNLAEAGLTVLAVSHRAVAFERADQVLHLDHGALSGF